VQALKYGVINTIDALQDLYTWQHMYLAGRMHKPIDILSDTAVCKCIQQAVLFNRVAAVTAAVLMQQDKQFTAHQLLRTIVSLSYTGTHPLFYLSRSVRALANSFQLLHSTQTLLLLPHNNVLNRHISLERLYPTIFDNTNVIERLRALFLRVQLCSGCKKS
jgi:Phosphatidate cytidylyltransferase, mitochondrial